LEEKLSKMLLSNNNISQVFLVKIISQTESTTIILALCCSYLYDELNNSYQIIGCYELDCNKIVNFNYSDKIQVWNDKKYCFQVGIDLGWDIKNTKAIVVGSNSWDEGPDCELCNNHCVARYMCYRHEEPMERCHWKETPLQVIVNVEEKTVGWIYL
jgi:hypothetical protein